MPRRTLKPEDHTMSMAPPVTLVAHDYGPHVEPQGAEQAVVKYQRGYQWVTAPVDPAIAAQRATINRIAHRQAQEAHHA